MLPYAPGIRAKVLAMLLLVGTVVCAIGGVLAARVGGATIRQSEVATLEQARASRAHHLRAWFDTLRQEMLSLGADEGTLRALRSLHDALPSPDPDTSRADAETLRAWYRDRWLPLAQAAGDAPDLKAVVPTDPVAIALQTHWLATDAEHPGHGDLLAGDPGATAYDAVHHRYDPFFQDLTQRFAVDDLYLVDFQNERVVYSVRKDVDFGTSLATGPWRDSGLATAFRAALRAPPGRAAIADYTPDIASFGTPEGYLAAPIREGSDLLGAVVIELPVSPIDAIMAGGRHDGLGRSGEVYLVGPDHLQRSDSHFLTKDPTTYAAQQRRIGTPGDTVDHIAHLGTTILLQPVRTASSTEALNGQVGTMVTRDYRDVPVLSAYAPLDVQGLHWAILAEMDLDEVQEPIAAFHRQVFGIATLAWAVGALLSMGIAVWLAAPLRALALSARQVNAGRWDPEVHVLSRDEVGEIGDSFKGMLATLRAQRRAIDQGEADNARLVDFVRSTFGQRVAEDVTAHLIAAPSRIEVSGEARDLTVLVAELGDFHAVTSALTPPDVIGLLDAYLQAMTEVVDAHHGVVVRHTGDELLAVFGAPVGLPGHAEHAVACALAMQERLDALDQKWVASGLARAWTDRGVPGIAQRIGVHTGTAVLGSVGAGATLQYTVVGDTVDEARRVETENDALGTRILVTAAVLQRLPAPLRERASPQERRVDVRDPEVLWSF